MSLAGRISWFPSPGGLWRPLRPPTSQRPVETDRIGCAIEVTRCVSVFCLEFHSFGVQQIEQSGRTLFVSDIRKVGGSLTVESSLMELGVLLTGTCIPHQRIVYVFKRQQDRLLILSELSISICAARRDPCFHPAPVQKRPVNVEGREVRWTDSIEG